MLLAVLTVLISLRCGPLLAAGLTGLIIVSPTGLEAITSIRGDALPIFIQLLALGLMVRKGQRALPTVILIGALCGLAMVAKISAVWGLMAIGLWLLAKDRKRLLFFACGFVGLLIIAALILWLLTGGRFFTSVLSLTFAGSGNLGAIVLLAPQRLMEFTTEWAPICWALLPLAAAGYFLRLGNRQFTPYHLALLCCLAILLVIYADWGVGENHVLDLLVLSTILVGDLAGQIPRQRRGMAVAHAGMAMVAVVGIPLAFLHKPLSADEKFETAGRDVMDAIGMLTGREVDVDYNPHPMAGMVAEDEVILSEDPYVPVSLGRKPVVLDGFMLKRMDQGPIDALVGRINNRQFGKVILLREMDAESWWYCELFFGEAISAAIDTNYVLNSALTEQAGGYYIYEPRITAPTDGAS